MKNNNHNIRPVWDRGYTITRHRRTTTQAVQWRYNVYQIKWCKANFRRKHVGVPETHLMGFKLWAGPPSNIEVIYFSTCFSSKSASGRKEKDCFRRR